MRLPCLEQWSVAGGQLREPPFEHSPTSLQTQGAELGLFFSTSLRLSGEEPGRYRSRFSLFRRSERFGDADGIAELAPECGI